MGVQGRVLSWLVGLTKAWALMTNIRMGQVTLPSWADLRAPSWHTDGPIVL